MIHTIHGHCGREAYNLDKRTVKGEKQDAGQPLGLDNKEMGCLVRELMGVEKSMGSLGKGSN